MLIVHSRLATLSFHLDFSFTYSCPHSSPLSVPRWLFHSHSYLRVALLSSPPSSSTIQFDLVIESFDTAQMYLDRMFLTQIRTVCFPSKSCVNHLTSLLKAYSPLPLPTPLPFQLSLPRRRVKPRRHRHFCRSSC